MTRTLQALAIASIRRVGPVTGNAIFSHIPQDLDPNSSDWIEFLLRGLPKIPRFKATEQDVTHGLIGAQKILEESVSEGVDLIEVGHDAYPTNFENILDRPLVLHCKGDVGLLNSAGIAIIGTRSPTSRAQDAGVRISTQVASSGCTIVSGLALGCDTTAHEACLESEGKTIAVLAHGLNYVFPEENELLAQRILEQGGLLVSEYPVGTEIRKNQFVARNRIQAGLSRGVIVIESDKESGTMRTVEFAQKYDVPIACWENQDGLASGNRYMLNELGAFSIKSPSDLNRFLDTLKLIRV